MIFICKTYTPHFADAGGDAVPQGCGGRGVLGRGAAGADSERGLLRGCAAWYAAQATQAPHLGATSFSVDSYALSRSSPAGENLSR